MAIKSGLVMKIENRQVMMKSRIWLLVLAMAGGVMYTGRLTQAADLVIKSFDITGQLTFSEFTTATVYRVEWANAPTGVWYTGSPGVTGIVARDYSQNMATVGVSEASCFYRVVAEIADYMMIDLSAGPSATNYPVSYLTTVPAGGWTEEYKTTKLVFRRIPAGTFTMGSPTNELGRYDDETQHQVTLKQPFYICVFDVTQKQWERVMGTWPSWFNNTSYRDSRPVEQVSYNDIRGASAGTNWPANGNVDVDSFMGRLRARTGKTFDLPTESQWEYAGRAGTTTALNSGYNLTNTNSDAHMSEVGRYWYNGGSNYEQSVDTSGATAQVGSYLPNQWGLYDIHGNVLEWCLDWYGSYPGTVSDPQGATSGSYRVFRGGSWSYGTDFCRLAFRPNYYPDTADRQIGFRTVLLTETVGIASRQATSVAGMKNLNNKTKCCMKNGLVIIAATKQASDSSASADTAVGPGMPVEDNLSF